MCIWIFILKTRGRVFIIHSKVALTVLSIPLSISPIVEKWQKNAIYVVDDWDDEFMPHYHNIKCKEMTTTDVNLGIKFLVSFLMSIALNMTILMRMSHFFYDNVVMKAFCNCLRYKEKLCDRFVEIEEKRKEKKLEAFGPMSSGPNRLVQNAQENAERFCRRQRKPITSQTFHTENIPHLIFHGIKK